MKYLIEFIHNMTRKWGDSPKLLFITCVEREEIVESTMSRRMETSTHLHNEGAMEFFGTPVYEHPYAEQIREKQLKIPKIDMATTHDIPIKEDIRRINGRMIAELKADIANNITHLDLEFENDPFSKIKRYFSLTQWFPIRKTKVRIEGKVLYPYLRVDLPHEPHSIKLKAI